MYFLSPIIQKVCVIFTLANYENVKNKLGVWNWNSKHILGTMNPKGLSSQCHDAVDWIWIASHSFPIFLMVYVNLYHP